MYVTHDTLVIISKVREYTKEIGKHIISSEYITAVYATRLLECICCEIHYYEDDGFNGERVHRRNRQAHTRTCYQNK